MGEYVKYIRKYYKYFSFNRKLFPINFKIEPSKRMYDAKMKVFSELPIHLMDLISKIPVVGSKKM